MRGQVVRASDNRPVCGARVHICEVDPIPIWILRLPDRELKATVEHELGQRRQWAAVTQQLRALPTAPGLGWDLREAQWLDHTGAQLLWNHWQRRWPERLECTPPQRDILERVAEFTLAEAPPPERMSLAAQVDHLGVLVLHGVSHASHMLEMVGQLVLDLGREAQQERLRAWLPGDHRADREALSAPPGGQRERRGAGDVPDRRVRREALLRLEVGVAQHARQAGGQ